MFTVFDLSPPMGAIQSDRGELFSLIMLCLCVVPDPVRVAGDQPLTR